MLAEKSREGELLGLFIKAKEGQEQFAKDLINLFWDRNLTLDRIIAEFPEYEKDLDESIKADEILKEILKDHSFGLKALSKLDEAQSAMMGSTNKLCYRQGIMDGIRLMSVFNDGSDY